MFVGLSVTGSVPVGAVCIAAATASRKSAQVGQSCNVRTP